MRRQQLHSNTPPRYRAAARISAAGLASVLAALAAMPASADELASDWVEGHNVRTRLIAGADRDGRALAALARVLPVPAHPAGKPRMVAGVEVAIGDGWKTYWRNPGDAGGVPPSFDWTGSSNLARATVLYPAPHRMIDKTGTTIGYKSDVVFPVLVEAANPAEPVVLKLVFAFGICREICVPGESDHAVAIPADADGVPEQIASALAAVPSRTPPAGAPLLRKADVTLDGAAPRVLLHAEFPGGRTGADAFVIGPDGEYVPVPVKKSEGAENTVTFEIDLTMGADVAALAGKPISVTLVSDHGHSEAEVVLTPGKQRD